MENKNKRFMILGIVGIVLLVVLICVGISVLPKFLLGKEIADALQPVIEAENQSMNLRVEADINEEQLALDTDIYMVREAETKYFVLEQNGYLFYVVDNVLFLENGKAFKIADEIQGQSEESENLFTQIMTMFEMFEIIKTTTDTETCYEVAVTGEQVEEIETLQVKVITKEKQLERVEISGSANANGTSMQVDVTISAFQILQEGEYEIPELIKESVATVDKDSLFSLSEDLYRLIVALKPFSDMNSINGTVRLSADCGLLQMDTTMNLSDLQMESNGQTNYQEVQQLPEMIGLLFLEGDISCTENGDAYVYKLVLDAETMERLAETIAPEIVNYVVSLTEGSAELTLEDESITTMKVVVKGNVNALFTKIPMEIGAEFKFEY